MLTLMHCETFFTRAFIYSLLVWSSHYPLAAALGNKTVIDYFPQLSDVQGGPGAIRPHGVGHFDTSRCCRLAMLQSLDVDSEGNLIKTSIGTSFIPGDLQSLIKGEFPCGAKYTAGSNGAPVVKVWYWWCHKNCGGWGRSSSRRLNQWISPMAGFIVPAVVFCLAIPRRLKIHLDDSLFNVHLNKLTSTPSILLRAPIAAILVSIDTVVWLVFIFALAGPILLSATFEALIDKRVLEYVEERIDNHRLTVESRARILYTILLGNLDTHGEEGQDDRAWNHMNSILINRLNEEGVESTQKCLRAMLATQYSFGITVGAPVVFFGASFVYTLVENYSQYGDNDLSLALAFGEFVQVVPHIAIVSGLLLAGNNPNTLEGVIRSPAPFTRTRWLGILGPAYQSIYQPAWIWNRGRSKKFWFARLRERAEFQEDLLHERLRIGLGDWILVALMAYSLIVIPAVMAILTAWFTVTVGLSCRSFTFLMYACCQFCLIILWIYDIETAHHHNPRKPSLKPQHWQKHRPETYIWWTLVIIFASAATLFAIGGTMMQVIGVYRNCLCLTPLTYWIPLNRLQNFAIEISTSSAESIDNSRTWWKGTGAGSVAFLGVSSFTGWWYQRLLRLQMDKVIDRIGSRVGTDDGPTSNLGLCVPKNEDPEAGYVDEKFLQHERRVEDISAEFEPENSGSEDHTSVVLGPPQQRSNVQVTTNG